ncbi:UNVERIFIED_CONTAM: hypothetical protein Sindi_0964900 [Sesamum indicum]
MAKTKPRKPAENAATGQPIGQSSATTEPLKTAATVNPSAFSDFISDLEASPSFITKNNAPNATVSRPKEIQPTKDASAENAGKKIVSFTGLFSTNLKLTDENKLTKFAIDEGPLTLGSNDLLDIRTKLGFCLVGYIVGKFPGLKVIRALFQSWVSSFQQHESGWLIFQFAREEERQHILAGGPYFIYGRPLLLKHMPDCFEFKEDDISLTPVWATLPSLPLECWHPNALGKISSRLGTPIAIDSLTMKMEGVSYARILVEVDASKKLIEQVEFVMPNDEACQGPHFLVVPAAAAPAAAPVKLIEAKKTEPTKWTMMQRRNKGKAIETTSPSASKVQKGQPVSKAPQLKKNEVPPPADSSSSSTDPDSPTSTQHEMPGTKTADIVVEASKPKKQSGGESPPLSL